MISRNSFWASCLENHKRRIWVWIVTVMMQLLVYVGVLTVYLSRIRYYNAEGMYRTLEEYRTAFVQAAQDALGFQPFLFFSVAILAVVIGKQGFSYLNDRRKVDMYHSVPVSKTKRFFVIYLNGIVIYLTATLFGLIAGTVVAAAQGAVTGSVLAVIGLAFVWNLLFFLVVYHTMILAVMLSGNSLVSLCLFGVLAAYEPLLYECLIALKSDFFERYSGYIVPVHAKASAFYDYYFHSYDIKWMETPQEMAETAAPYLGKWLVLALLLFVAAYVCYQRRMSEAAGKAIAFNVFKPVLKIMAALVAGMFVGVIVRDAAYENDVLMLVGMLLGGVVCCAVLEVVYEFDLRCMLRHWVSSVAAVLGVLAVFCIFKFDLLGYDSYVPDADKVESIVFLSNTEYLNYWDENSQYISETEYLMEHMHLTAVEKVLTLARKDQQESYEVMKAPRRVEVVYRMKSGRKVERGFYVDFANPANEELLNHIIGSREYREGAYQIVTDPTPFDKVQSITYSNGCTKSILPLEDAQMLREAYLKDLEQMDFSLVRHHFPCGTITFGFPNYMSREYPVYDTYANVLSYLKEQNVYYPVQLDAEDVASVTVTNFHNELYENGEEIVVYDSERAAAVYTAKSGAYENASVTETFYEPEQIAEILKHIYPSDMQYNWHDAEEFDSNYNISVEFKKDSDYPYNRAAYYFNYNILAGQVPEFVAEATALE